jgi:hypothetical protein
MRARISRYVSLLVLILEQPARRGVIGCVATTTRDLLFRK